MTPPITKSLFLSSRTCPTLGWFLRNDPLPSISTEAELFRMEQGKEIGRLARTLFPGGRLIPGGTNEATAALTLNVMNDPNVNVLFEGTFLAGNYVAKADILMREMNGWRVIEVKSNLADTDQIEDLIDDLAYTVMVLNHAGLKIIAAELMLMSPDYRKGQPTSQLFKRLDQTEAVTERMDEYDDLWDSVEKATSGKKPKPKLLPDCRKCEYFEEHCLGKGIKYSVFCLPSLHPNKVKRLSGDSVVSISDLPQGFPLTDLQRRVVRCIKSGKPSVASDLKSGFKDLRWPVSYLDFETVMTALPLYDGIAPWAQIATQFSMHQRHQPDGELKHVDYLADAKRDCEEQLAERLIESVGEKGSVMVYSAFEKTRINALAERFPRLAKKLLKISDRLFDLLKVIREAYYHPDFEGSFSIKVVLPVLVPELKYDGLAIADGGAATAEFAKIAMGMYSAADIEMVRRNLLQYCKTDTLALVEIHRILEGMCEK